MLPPQERPVWQQIGLTQVVIPREELQQQRIEQVVARHVGRPVFLGESEARMSVLPSIDRFYEQTDRHRSDHSFGFAVRSFFERLKQA